MIMTITMMFYPTWSKNDPTREVLSGYEFTERDLAESMVSEDEIFEIARSLDVRVHELLRTRSPIYQEQKDQLLAMSESDLAVVIASEPTLIKRPIIKTDRGYVVGFDEDKIRQLLEAEVKANS